MLDQLAKHSGADLTVKVNGDLQIDEHHTIEDTALALGEAYLKALGDKKALAAMVFYFLWTNVWLRWRLIFQEDRGWYGMLSLKEKNR